MLPRPATWMTHVRSTARPTSARAPAAFPLLKSATRGSATRPCGSSLTRQGTSDASLSKKKRRRRKKLTEKHTHWRFSKWLITDKSWMYTTKDVLQKEEWFWSGKVRGVVKITINNHVGLFNAELWHWFSHSTQKMFFCLCHIVKKSCETV